MDLIQGFPDVLDRWAQFDIMNFLQPHALATLIYFI